MPTLYEYEVDVNTNYLLEVSDTFLNWITLSYECVSVVLLFLCGLSLTSIHLSQNLYTGAGIKSFSILCFVDLFVF